MSLAIQMIGGQPCYNHPDATLQEGRTLGLYPRGMQSVDS